MDRDFPITSPCVGVCQINAGTGFCLGCWRSLKEVARWARFSEDEKRETIAAIRTRQEAAGLNQRRPTRRTTRRQRRAAASPAPE